MLQFATTTTLYQKVQSRANTWVTCYTPKLERFAERFTENPAAALEWSNEVFVAAAYTTVAKFMLYGLTEANVAARLNALMRDILNNARNPSRSTSTPSNEMALNLNAARAQFIDGLLEETA